MAESPAYGNGNNATRKARALITGGAGFIGSHLSQALVDRGFEVTVIDNLATGQLGNIARLVEERSVRIYQEDVCNEAILDRLVPQCDVVFHLAAAVGVELILKDPIKVIDTNILGSHTVLKAAQRYGKKVLIASTSEVYGKGTRVPFQEDDDSLIGPTSKARWSYAVSKAVDEFLALAYHRQLGLPTVVFRLFNTVGAGQSGQYGMVIPRFVRQALRSQPITVYGDGEQSRCFCAVEDAVRAIIGLAESDEALGRVFNIGSTDEITIGQLARRVLRLVDEAGERSAGLAALEDGRIVHIPYSEAYEPGFEDLRRRIPDTTRIRATIGWEPRISLDETLRKVIAYERSRMSE